MRSYSKLRLRFRLPPIILFRFICPEEHFVSITDYKTGPKFFPKAEADQIAVKASLHLLAQMSLALPKRSDRLAPNIKVQIRDIRAIKPASHVEIKHIILSDPPQIIDPLEELGIDLHDPRQASRLDQDFADLVETIRHDERLESVVGEKEKVKILPA